MAEWGAVRDQFSLSRDFIHLNSMLVASHPKCVRDAIDMFSRRFDENPTLCLLREKDENDQRTLDAAAAYMGVRASDIAITTGTAMGLGLLYHGLPLVRGDEILASTHEHRYGDESMRLVAQRTGATVRKVPLYEHAASASTAQIVEAVVRAIRPETRVIGLTWVHSSSGVKLPVRAICDAIERACPGPRRPLVVVDGVHGFGVEDIAIPELGCDFFIAGTHKWICGPRGTGVMWGRDWSALHPTIPPLEDEWADSWARGDRSPQITGWAMSPGGMRSHEYRWALAEAFAFHLRLGKSAVQGRIHELARRCKEGLAAMPHVRLATPLSPELSSGIVCFEVEGREPEQVVRHLIERQIIASITPYLPTCVRFSPGLVNTPAEIDAVLEEVDNLRFDWT